MQKDKYSIEFNVKQAQQSLGTLRTAVKGFIGVLAVREVLQFGNTIIEASRKFQTYENQLRLITDGSEDLNRVMGLLQASARGTRTSFENFLDLFVKLRVTTDALGISEERVVAVTEKLSQALQVAGADTATANAVIRQFGQAMASGEVRGDEFRSIVEGLGPALAIMARESGKTVGELRKMSRAGELSAEVMFDLFEKSNALTNAFKSQQVTISQLEQMVSDAFTAATNKVSESTGFAKLYEGILKSILRTLDQIAETDGALVNMNVADIMQGVEKDTIKAADAAEELRQRYLKLLDIGPLDFLIGDKSISEQLKGTYNEQRKQYRELYLQLQELAKEQEKQQNETTARNKKIAEDQKKLNELINAEVKGIKASVDEAQKYAKLEFGTPLEKANRKLAEAQKTLENLSKAQEVINKNQHLNSEGLKDYTFEIDAAKKAVAEYQAQVQKLTVTPLNKFYNELIQNSQNSVQQIEITKQALEKLNAEFANGNISLEVYNTALKTLNEALGKSDKLAVNLKKAVGDYSETLNQSVQDAQVELDQLNMSELEKDIDNVARKMRRDLNTQIKELRDLERQGANKQDIDKAIADITRSTEAAIQKQKEIAEQVYEQQRSFEYGWKRAFEEYADNATNAAKQAEAIFKKTTQTMEDTIVDFVKTGKFEFKGLINDILEQILRSQIQQIISQVFAFGKAGQGGSALGSLFGGFFANGGFLPSGKFGIAGENGPELITGPAQITPLQGIGGSQNVVYNINAVDAISFKQMVARDPGFIHSVAAQGARKVPIRR
jgi:lambda family phage tail tape measure protein